ncbi:MAG: hypothetical protein GTO60_16475 [Gammaproteobacteria bacterium]|nr:hypothetical protein [Gammaproteobacteria bacterium]
MMQRYYVVRCTIRAGDGTEKYRYAYIACDGKVSTVPAWDCDGYIPSTCWRDTQDEAVSLMDKAKRDRGVDYDQYSIWIFTPFIDTGAWGQNGQYSPPEDCDIDDIDLDDVPF